MSRRGLKKARSESTVNLPVASWPEADRTLWDRAHRSRNVLESGGRAAKWSPRTITNVETDYGRWLKWLRDNQNVDLRIPPTERVTRDRVKLYVAHLSQRLELTTVQLHLQRLGQMMTAFTDTKEFNWLFRAANRLNPASSRNKLAKMQSSYLIADLGIKLMEQIERLGDINVRQSAVLFRDGLIIALLAYRPVRLSNLCKIQIGEQLAEIDRQFFLVYRAEETKQRRTVCFPVPSALQSFLRRYLQAYRPMLLAHGRYGGQRSNYLWVSSDGGPLTSQSISDLIRQRTRAEFGIAINPHLFRDCAATTIATDDPSHAFAIPGVLGHSSMATSERHYNQARMLEAAEHYQGVLAKQRRRRSA